MYFNLPEKGGTKVTFVMKNSEVLDDHLLQSGCDEIPGEFTDTTGLESRRIKGWLTDAKFECCPWRQFQRPNPINLLSWKFGTTNRSNIPDINDTQGIEKLERTLPIRSIDTARLSEPPPDKLQATWIGHATILVQFDGISILTDPIFGEWRGPDGLYKSYKRYRKAPCKITDLPKIDAVLISNNHFGHLNELSVRQIYENFEGVKWFVALEQKQFLVENGVNESHITELDWWQTKNFDFNGKQFNFICTPAQHWCRRGAFDINQVLWCSWVVKGPTKSFYFSGATGYYETLFKTIGTKYGPFDLAAIAIGNYEPRFITEFEQVDPEEAVQIHRDVRSKQSIGIQWGTFEFTNEFYAEPPQRVEKEMKKNNLSADRFISLCHGETWVIGEQRQRPPFMDVAPNQAGQ